VTNFLVRVENDDPPAGEDQAAAVRDAVQRLVALDVANGGDQTSILATRALRAAEPMLAPRAYEPKAERDLRAAMAELAELTGWLLCDANRHSESLARNHQALRLARLAGDHSMELFVIHNMSLQATYLRRPERSLELVRPVLDQDRLTPRLSAMFQLRVARAYAQMGLHRMAIKTLDTATGLFYEGSSERDPAWSWWISARGFDHATGAMLGGLGDWKAAIDPIQRALDAAPDHARRDRFLYMCVLLHAQIKVRACRDAAATAERLVPYIGQVRSARPLARLIATITGPPNVARCPRMDDAVTAINHALGRSSGPIPSDK
jgi:tetratricopeptide (TPR) repeat protein